MSSYRDTPAKQRAQLIERRAELRREAKRLSSTARKKLPQDLADELHDLETQLGDKAFGDTPGAAGSVLKEYDDAVAAAVAADAQTRVRTTIVRRIVMVVAVLLLVRAGFVLRKYNRIAASCAEHFHCRHAGECGVGFYYDGLLGVEMLCAANEPDHCAGPCAARGRCEIVDERCVPTAPQHCRASEGCKEHGHCEVRNGRCEVGSLADCTASEGCRKHGECYRGYWGQCVVKSEEVLPHERESRWFGGT